MRSMLLRCYNDFLKLYPREFRVRYGREMQLLLRDYARDHGSVAVGMFLFSDLLLSVPREHVRGANMQRLVTATAGALMLGVVGAQLFYDASRQDMRMGFLLLLVLTTMTIAGVYLLLRQRPRRLLWFIPAAYAAAASSWLLVTPIRVGGFAPLRPFIFSLGQPAAIAFLFLPVFVALLPVLWPKQRTVATIAMLVFLVLAMGMVSTYFAPAAVAMVVVRFLSSHRAMETRRAH